MFKFDNGKMFPRHATKGTDTSCSERGCPVGLKPMFLGWFGLLFSSVWEKDKKYPPCFWIS